MRVRSASKATSLRTMMTQSSRQREILSLPARPFVLHRLTCLLPLTDFWTKAIAVSSEKTIFTSSGMQQIDPSWTHRLPYYSGYAFFPNTRQNTVAASWLTGRGSSGMAGCRRCAGRAPKSAGWAPCGAQPCPAGAPPGNFGAVTGRERASGPTRRAKWAKKWFALRHSEARDLVKTSR